MSVFRTLKAGSLHVGLRRRSAPFLTLACHARIGTPEAPSQVVTVDDDTGYGNFGFWAGHNQGFLPPSLLRERVDKSDGV